MNQIVAFDFESHDVRVVIGQDGEPRFVAADLLSTLSLDRKALERLDDDEKGVSSIHTPGGQQEMTVSTSPVSSTWCSAAVSPKPSASSAG